MKNITVQGLSHIYRNGNAVMKNNSNIIDIQLQLNDKNIIVTSDLNVKTDIKNFENLNCQISYDNIHINFKFEKNHDQFKVKEFKIVHFENCQVNIQGSSEVEANDYACRQIRKLINQSINKA
uniref:Mite allergen Lep d 7-like n=1 Tax=Dermatophagoides pteronyssinus TaxID=6956 RepID=A0A6P6YGS3_DERPT|nr:mite allergen Lep d 7-like [Dermatophagoides pteronyssinus]